MMDFQSTGRTADRFVHALMFDLPLSAGIIVDFGVDSIDIHRAYQQKVRAGEVTADQLDAAVLNGKQLSQLIGIKITTSLDFLNEMAAAEEEEEQTTAA